MKISEKILELLERLGIKISKEILMYLIFGVLTTIVSYAIYIACILSGAGIVEANTTATIIGVLFAFATNKTWVFESRSYSLVVMGPEFLKFSSGRVIVYFVETGLLILLVDMMNLDKIISKLFTMVIVVISNYFISKKAVFK